LPPLAPTSGSHCVSRDEARLSQKGRVCRRWWLRGLRPPGLVDQRHDFAYVFAAVEPATGRNVCLVLPEVSTKAMNRFLADFSLTRSADTHAVMILDGAGWHASHELRTPDNVSLLRLLPYAPELNPVERVWLFLCERHLSHRLLNNYDAIVDAACNAWRQLTPQQLRS
jgi:hypothetical protein